MAAFYPAADGYTIAPGIVGNSLNTIGTFKSLLVVVPAPGGIIQVSWILLLFEPPASIPVLAHLKSGACF